MADDIGKIIAGIVSIFGILLFLIVASVVFSQLGEQQCQPYKDTINQKNSEIDMWKGQLNETSRLLGQCKNDYEALIKENITKKDIEEIKGYYNLTQIQINNLNQKFEETNNNYFNFYKILLKNYQLSLTINIAIGITLLSIEISSFIFLKNEFIMFVVQSIIKHKKRKEEND
jgi:hypothetical protein